MNIWKIISEFLGIQGVFFEDIRQYKRDHRAEIKVRLRRDHFFCRDCGLELGKIKDWQFKVVQAPPLGIYQKIRITVHFPRAWCECCEKNKPAALPWIHKVFPSMTCGFAETCGRLMEETTCRATSRIMKTSARKMWELDEYRMQRMLERLRLPPEVDFSFLSVDEVHFRTILKERKNIFSKKREPLFVTNLVSYGNSKVLFNAMGRDSVAIEDCLLGLSKGQKLAVEGIAVDMHEPYISVIKTELPNALICVDRFHLAQSINKCFDKLRKLELKKAKDQFTQGMLAPSRRFILMEKEKKLVKTEKKLLDKLRKLNTNIHNGMLIVEYFHKLLDKKNLKSFRKSLTNWYQLVRQSRIPVFRKFAKQVRRYRSNIEAYILTRLTTSVSEGLNNKIKTLKKMGYGYTNDWSFRLKILQRCGYLNHNWIKTDKWLYTSD